ncbi:hypothetical protein PM082_001808 [Marasmius tenuissimus]|nr:hypothetical protein PM082_001808 [Marasmius tenuissimus]
MNIEGHFPPLDSLRIEATLVLVTSAPHPLERSTFKFRVRRWLRLLHTPAVSFISELTISIATLAAAASLSIQHVNNVLSTRLPATDGSYPFRYPPFLSFPSS